MAKRTKPAATRDADSPPSDSDVAARLGTAHDAFRALTTRSGIAIEWRRYNAASPWVVKATQGERTLFYARPDDGFFEVTVLLGERATEAALGGRVTKKLHEAIRTARPYAEGRPVRVAVKSVKELVGIDQLIAVKLNPAK